MRSVKLRWARKILGAKFFVVLTDREGVIALDGADPNQILDVVALTAQSAELQDFADKLSMVIKDHDRAIRKLNGLSDKPKRSTRATTKRRTKIQVKQG